MADLSPFFLPCRFWRGNLHTHSNLSDGARPLGATIDAYKAAGYDFVQLSEHFVARYRWPIADTRDWRSNNFTTIIGAELHAPATGPLRRAVHLAEELPLAPGREPMRFPDASEQGNESLLFWRDGRLAQVAHPRRWALRQT